MPEAGKRKASARLLQGLAEDFEQQQRSRGCSAKIVEVTANVPQALLDCSSYAVVILSPRTANAPQLRITRVCHVGWARRLIPIRRPHESIMGMSQGHVRACLRACIGKQRF
jgi:hypothetical protein